MFYIFASNTLLLSPIPQMHITIYNVLHMSDMIYLWKIFRKMSEDKRPSQGRVQSHPRGSIQAVPVDTRAEHMLSSASASLASLSNPFDQDDAISVSASQATAKSSRKDDKLFIKDIVKGLLDKNDRIKALQKAISHIDELSASGQAESAQHVLGDMCRYICCGFCREFARSSDEQVQETFLELFVLLVCLTPCNSPGPVWTVRSRGLQVPPRSSWGSWSTKALLCLLRMPEIKVDAKTLAMTCGKCSRGIEVNQICCDKSKVPRVETLLNKVFETARTGRVRDTVMALMCEISRRQLSRNELKANKDLYMNMTAFAKFIASPVYITKLSPKDMEQHVSALKDSFDTGSLVTQSAKSINIWWSDMCKVNESREGFVEDSVYQQRGQRVLGIEAFLILDCDAHDKGLLNNVFEHLKQLLIAPNEPKLPSHVHHYSVGVQNVFYKISRSALALGLASHIDGIVIRESSNLEQKDVDALSNAKQTESQHMSALSDLSRMVQVQPELEKDHDVYAARFIRQFVGLCTMLSGDDVILSECHSTLPWAWAGVMQAYCEISTLKSSVQTCEDTFEATGDAVFSGISHCSDNEEVISKCFPILMHAIKDTKDAAKLMYNLLAKILGLSALRAGVHSLLCQNHDLAMDPSVLFNGLHRVLTPQVLEPIVLVMGARNKIHWMQTMLAVAAAEEVPYFKVVVSLVHVLAEHREDNSATDKMSELFQSKDGARSGSCDDLLKILVRHKSLEPRCVASLLYLLELLTLQDAMAVVPHVDLLLELGVPSCLAESRKEESAASIVIRTKATAVLAYLCGSVSSLVSRQSRAALDEMLCTSRFMTAPGNLLINWNTTSFPHALQDLVAYMMLTKERATFVNTVVNKSYVDLMEGSVTEEDTIVLIDKARWLSAGNESQEAFQRCFMVLTHEHVTICTQSEGCSKITTPLENILEVDLASPFVLTFRTGDVSYTVELPNGAQTWLEEIQRMQFTRRHLSIATDFMAALASKIEEICYGTDSKLLKQISETIFPQIKAFLRSCYTAKGTEDHVARSRQRAINIIGKKLLPTLFQVYPSYSAYVADFLLHLLACVYDLSNDEAAVVFESMRADNKGLASNAFEAPSSKDTGLGDATPKDVSEGLGLLGFSRASTQNEHNPDSDFSDAIKLCTTLQNSTNNASPVTPYAQIEAFLTTGSTHAIPAQDAASSIANVEVCGRTFRKVQRVQESRSAPLVATSNTMINLTNVLDAAMLELHEDCIPVLIEGPTGVGKTAIVSEAARLIGQRLIRFNMSESLGIDDFFGKFTPTGEDGVPKFVPGPFIVAFQNGFWLLVDELNLADDRVLQSIETALDSGTLHMAAHNDHDDNDLNHDQSAQLVHIHKDFRLFATQNPAAGHYAGQRSELSQSFMSRFKTIPFFQLPASEWQFIVQKMLQPSLGDGAEDPLQAYASLMQQLHSSIETLIWQDKFLECALRCPYAEVTVRDLLKVTKVAASILSSQPASIHDEECMHNHLGEQFWYVYGLRFRTETCRAQIWKEIKQVFSLCNSLEQVDTSSLSLAMESRDMDLSSTADYSYWYGLRLGETISSAGSQNVLVRKLCVNRDLYIELPSALDVRVASAVVEKGGLHAKMVAAHNEIVQTLSIRAHGSHNCVVVVPHEVLDAWTTEVSSGTSDVKHCVRIGVSLYSSLFRLEEARDKIRSIMDVHFGFLLPADDIAL
jgi:hypothetical protein